MPTSRSIKQLARDAVRERRRRVGFNAERLASWFMYNNAGLWRWVRATPILNSFVNRQVINWLATRTPSRPTPLSLWGSKPGRCDDYPSWSSLADRTFTGRHLPPRPSDAPPLPDESSITPLFRRLGVPSPCPKSTALFCFFAQWFTDSYLRTDTSDVRKNTSNHEIDLCQIYGLNPCDTAILREPDESGKLKTQVIEGQVYPRQLFESDGKTVVGEFRGLSYINPEGTNYRNQVLPPAFDTPETRAKLFVAGLERGNSTIFYSAVNVIFLREHNRLCDLLKEKHPAWDGDRLFETARNINIAQLIKVIVEDYINHISPARFPVFFEPGFAESKGWYRTNRIAAEFNLLYRWHSLVPTTFLFDGKPLQDTEFRFNDRGLVAFGLEPVFSAASTQSAGRISLKNTPEFLWPAEDATLKKGRSWMLRSFNDYRERFNLARVGSFFELTGDERLAAELATTYDTVDDVDLMVGLLAEQRHVDHALFGNLMTYMVGVDAFTQALTNPLLSTALFNEETYTKEGLALLKETSTFAQIVERNVRSKPAVRFTLRAVDPPRDLRLPFIGKVQDILGVLTMFLSWESYFMKHRQKHASPVFGVNLFQPTLAVLDHKAISPLFDSPDFVQDYGFSWAKPPRALVGSVPSIYQTGAAHEGPKAFYIDLLKSKQPSIETVMREVADEFIDRWLDQPKILLCDELERLAATFLTRWFLGRAFPEPDKLRLLYSNLFSHVYPKVTDIFRGGIYKKSKAIRTEWLAFIEDSPDFKDVMLPLATKHGLDDRKALIDQVAFMVGMNSFLGLQNLLKSLVAELDLHPDWTKKCRDAPAGGPLDLVLSETLRLHPPVTFIFGRATHSRPLEATDNTYNVCGDQLVMGVLPFALRDEKLFPEPNVFNPDRFKDPVVFNNLIWSRGRGNQPPSASNRVCAAQLEGPLVARAFAKRLMERARWTFTTPPTWDAKMFSLNVAAPKGNLEAHFERIAPIA